MSHFETPEPISVELELGVTGHVRITATDRTDTHVEVRPSDESDDSDVAIAQQVDVEYASGILRIKGPKVRPFDFSRRTRSVDVTVELPTDSRVSGEVQLGDIHGTGRLGETRLKTGTGDIRVERTGPLRLNTATGHVTVDHAAGDAEIRTASGRVSTGRIDGTAAVKDSNGNIDIDAIAGEARVRSANGDISVDLAEAGIEAKTSNGAVRLGEIVRGSVELATPTGELEIGIAEGTAAWLDVDTGFGHVRNLLDDAARPEDSDETVEVRARTSHGDITIRRA